MPNQQKGLDIPKLTSAEKIEIMQSLRFIARNKTSALKLRYSIDTLFQELAKEKPQYIKYLNETKINEEIKTWLVNTYKVTKTKEINNMIHLEIGNWPHWQLCACRDLEYQWEWSYHDHFIKFNIKLIEINKEINVLFDLEQDLKLLQNIRNKPEIVLTSNIDKLNLTNLLYGQAQAIILADVTDTILNIIDFFEITINLRKELEHELN